MKTLYLIRHAKSSWDDPYQKDFERPLNKRGKQDAPRMGKRLKAKNILPDLMLTSPAARALSTCKLMADILGYRQENIATDKKLYHAPEEQILAIIHKMNDNHQSVMIFAHNPGITECMNNLFMDSFVADNIPTCGVVAFKFPVEVWAEVNWKKGGLEFFDFPKNKTA